VSDYSYLFPYEKIPYGSRVLIYGAGDVGHEYLTQILMTGYCECLGFVDRAFDKCPATVVPVYSIEMVKTFPFEYVVIAVKTAIYVDEIRNSLEQQGVPPEKIVFVGPRKAVSLDVGDSQATGNMPQRKLAFEQSGVAIAMRLSAALGDCIVRKRVFDEIIQLEPNCRFDIYAPYASSYIQAVYGHHLNLNCIVDDAGVLYKRYMHKYQIAISSINPRLAVDFWDKEALKKKSQKLFAVIAGMVENIKTYGLSDGAITQNYIHYNRMRYKKRNYYASYGQFSDLFNKIDSLIHIPLDESYRKKYQALCLGKYVTVNFETGISSADSQHMLPKQWPAEYFSEFLRLFKEKYSGIEVVQLGAYGAVQLSNVDKYLFGENLELVKYVLQGAVMHIDIEGGLVHLATQLGTKCAVLFGPTPVDFFGYPQNINIVSPRCSGCYGLYDDLNHCAKEQPEPECMKAITPDMVLKAITEYINKRI